MADETSGIMTLDRALAIIEDKMMNRRCRLTVDYLVTDGSGMDFNAYLRPRDGKKRGVWAGGPTVKDVVCGVARAAEEYDVLSEGAEDGETEKERTEENGR